MEATVNELLEILKMRADSLQKDLRSIYKEDAIKRLDKMQEVLDHIKDKFKPKDEG